VNLKGTIAAIAEIGQNTPTMRISLNWLQELVDINVSAEALADLLTMAGFEVEDIEDRRAWAKGVVVGQVLSRQQHPNADKLSICDVNIGAEKPSQIVCGAANVGVDQYVPVATLGTYLPQIDLKIKPAKLRGVASEGMICSLAELGLAKDSDGIHVFGRVGEAQVFTPGDDVRPLLGLDDVILDVTSTANRADVLSMVGLAREVAAITGATLKLPEINIPAVPNPKKTLQLQVSDSHACPRYIGTTLENVEIQPSPTWLQRRLQACGIRAINNVVDITNLILLEWGQPLHAFDGDRVLATAKAKSLSNLTLGVRYAEEQSQLVTLDGQARSLHSQNLIITANQEPVALAGLMGGEATEVGPETQTLILEAAVFDAAVIRRSARAQGLRTEASIRYERGVNATELDLACNRAIQLLQDLAGATITGQVSTTLPKQWSTGRTVNLKLGRVRQILGSILPDGVATSDDLTDNSEWAEVSAETVTTTLGAIGCTLKAIGDEEWDVTIPPYRYRDLEREIDLIEEVARLYGYHNFIDTLPAKTEPGYLSLDESLIRQVRSHLRGAGLTELVHYSVVKPDASDRQVVIANPLFAEYSALRTDLISGLIDACQLNLEQGNGCLNGFEIGRVFSRDEQGLQETDAIAGILGGETTQGIWVRGGQSQPMTWFEAKGILETFFIQVGITVEYQPDLRDSRFHPGRTASLWLQGERLGILGQIHPQVCQARDLPEAVYAFELNLDVLLNALDQDEKRVPIFKPFSIYPASDRDIAFFAPTTTAVADLQRAMKKAGGSLLESIELFDEYRGEHVPAGQRSLAFRLIYRTSDRTLTDSDIDPVHQTVRTVLQEQFSVTLRS
jgi:phenylalanyl-tRNA synthetase beta chain